MTNTIDGIRYMSITDPENHSLPGNFNHAKAYTPRNANNKHIKTEEKTLFSDRNAMFFLCSTKKCFFCLTSPEKYDSKRHLSR